MDFMGRRTHLLVTFSAEGHGVFTSYRHNSWGLIRSGALGTCRNEVAVRWSAFSHAVIPWFAYLGKRSTTVQPSRSRYPQRTLLVCMNSGRYAEDVNALFERPFEKRGTYGHWKRTFIA